MTAHMRYEDDSAHMILYKYLLAKHECKWSFSLHFKDGRWMNCSKLIEQDTFSYSFAQIVSIANIKQFFLTSG